MRDVSCLLVLLLAAALTAGIFLWGRLRRRRLDRAARRQFFYRACRKHAIAVSGDLAQEEKCRLAVRLARECGLSRTDPEALGRILDAEKSAYEARRRAIR